MSKIEIKKDRGTHILIDDREIHRVIGYTLEQSIDTVPTITLDVVGDPNVETEGIVKCRRVDLIEEIKKLQTYKMFDGCKELFVSLEDVMAVLEGKHES